MGGVPAAHAETVARNVVTALELRAPPSVRLTVVNALTALLNVLSVSLRAVDFLS